MFMKDTLQINIKLMTSYYKYNNTSKTHLQIKMVKLTFLAVFSVYFLLFSGFGPFG